MKIAVVFFSFAALFMLAALPTSAQQNSAKGIDNQNKQIKDISTGQGPTDNGTNRGVGTGRGIDWGKGKTPERAALANPYRLGSKRDILLATIMDIMKERGLVLDEAASRTADGLLITQPYTFVKGAVIAGSQLQRFAVLPDGDDGAWTRGRYTLTIDVQTIDGNFNNVSVTAKVEGRSESALGSQWLTLTSSGTAENDFLSLLVERVTGTSPYSVPTTEPTPQR